MRFWVLLIVAWSCLAPRAEAQLPQPNQVFGRWLSEDKHGVIDLYPCDGKICGKIAWMLEPTYRGAPRVDFRNPDPGLRQRPLCGLTVLGGFQPSTPQFWSDGWIYDPWNGKTYHATLFLESTEVLRLRGYIGTPFLGKTQTWTRPDGSYGAC